MKVSQAHREQAKAENDSAFERLRADMERHNAEQNEKIAEQSKDMIKFTATMSVGIVVVLGAFIAFLHFYK